MDIQEQVERLHECKRGLSVATGRDYNQWWRSMESLLARNKLLEKVLEAAIIYPPFQSVPDCTCDDCAASKQMRVAIASCDKKESTNGQR